MIHQLLCTHCTFASSALESGRGETAQRVLGYSVRASSFDDMDELREEYRAVERLLAYELPVDATTTDRTTLNAATAPRRTFYVPSIGGRTVCGQIAYRAFDTAGRPGSYCAHLLVEKPPAGGGDAARRTQPPEATFSALDCLRLAGLSHREHGRGWHHEDDERDLGTYPSHSASSTPRLPTLQSLNAWAHDAGRLWDQAVVAFLHPGACSPAMPPGIVLPDRWKSISSDDRRSLLASVLHATISPVANSAAPGGPRAVLAIEPDVAAVLFYATLRLVPTTVLRGIGFTTYESDPFRSSWQLAATTFLHATQRWNPQPPHATGLVCDTFAGPPWTPLAGNATAGDYAQWALKHLEQDRLEEFQTALQCIDGSWKEEPPSGADLDRVGRLAQHIDGLFEYDLTPPPRSSSSPCDRTRQFVGEYCYKIMPPRLKRLRDGCQGDRTLAKKWNDHKAKLLELLPQAAGEEAWKRLRDTPDVKAFTADARPKDEHDLIKHLSRSNAPLSDDDARDAICDFCRAKKRLPGAGDGSDTPKPKQITRLWGDPDKDTYSPPDLLVDVLAAVDHTDLPTILPKGFRPAPVLGIVTAVAKRVQNAKGAEHTRLTSHLRTLLDEAAETLGTPKLLKLLGDASLKAAKASDAYGTHPDRLSKKLTDIVRGLGNELENLCKNAGDETHKGADRVKHVMHTLKHWANDASDYTLLHETLKSWEHVLYWFGAHADGGTAKGLGFLSAIGLLPAAGKQPFEAGWEPKPPWPQDHEKSLREVMRARLQSIDHGCAKSAPRRSQLLRTVLVALITAKVIDIKRKTELEGLIDTLCSESKGKA